MRLGSLRPGQSVELTPDPSETRHVLRGGLPIAEAGPKECNR